MDELAALFDLGKLSRAPARFDVDELRALNARLLHEMPYETVAPRLKALKITGGEKFWHAVRPNLSTFDDVKAWWKVVKGPVTPLIEGPEFCTAALTLLPEEPWSESTWSDWTGAVKTATGAKGRELFHPLASRPHGAGARTGIEISATAHRTQKSAVPPFRESGLTLACE